MFAEVPLPEVAVLLPLEVDLVFLLLGVAEGLFGLPLWVLCVGLLLVVVLLWVEVEAVLLVTLLVVLLLMFSLLF